MEESAWKPLCTTCAYPLDHVYTTYSSASNIRLTVCPRCNAFADPLIESPALFLALDLVLLKPRVFLHLLFNRGSPPRVAGDTKDGAVPSRRNMVYASLTYLTLATVAAEVSVRLLPLLPTSLSDLKRIAGLTALRVVAELSAQLGVTTLLALVVLRVRGWYPPTKRKYKDGRQEAFMPALIPAVLLFTALIPLLLQLILGIWTPSLVPHHGEHLPSYPSNIFTGSIPQILPLSLAQHLAPITEPIKDVLQEVRDTAAVAWDTDPIWAGTRLLGGMSAGFGLRVLLPTRPWETTGIVLAGWAAAGLAGKWVDTLFERL